MKYSGFHVDINQANPHIARYLIQNTIWWIEYARIDAIRQDTYPYADYDMMRQWNLEVMAEYPQFNIVGEVWTEHAIGTSWWQKDSPLNKRNTYLKSVMDFALMGMASDVFNDKSENGSMNRIYDHLAYDFVYPDVKNLLRFLENHDTSRFLRSEPENLDAFKQGTAFLLTITGTPQVYYGYEMLMNGSTSSPGGDGNVRLDVPGGWPGDKVSWFTPEGRSAMQNEAWTYMSKLLKWRQGNRVISEGEMKHFVPQNGVYVYERWLGDKNVMVFINGANKEVTIDLARYAESIKGQTRGVDVTTQRTVQLGDKLTMAAKEVLVLDMYK
jgi:glycosidase